jgi:hypothetical protein
VFTFCGVVVCIDIVDKLLTLGVSIPDTG